MIRKLLLPALLVGLLGGCATAYDYRDGYYYGRPGVDYRYRDYGYPYGAYPYGYYPYGGRYGYYNYYYGSPYYGPYRYPYYYNPYYRPHDHRHPTPPVPTTPPPGPGTDRGDERRLPPWRDLSRRRPADAPVPGQRVMVPSQPQPQLQPAPRREQRSDAGSAARQIMQRKQDSRRRDTGSSQEP